VVFFVDIEEFGKTAAEILEEERRTVARASEVRVDKLGTGAMLACGLLNRAD